MKQNLKSKTISIDDKDYELPPNVFWDEQGRRFRVHGRVQEEVIKRSFSTKIRSVDDALEMAIAYASQRQAERLAKPPYKTQGLDDKGNPVPLGHGIYMQINTDRGNYQLIKVIYGTKGKGNQKSKSFGLGRAGYFTKHKFDAVLKKAKALQKQWAREDAANEQHFKTNKKVSA